MYYFMLSVQFGVPVFKLLLDLCMHRLEDLCIFLDVSISVFNCSSACSGASRSLLMMSGVMCSDTEK
jgi:hypothetical protein